MSRTINTAIVGYGYAGKSFHSYLVSLTPGLKLYAVSTRDAGRRAAAESDHDVITYSRIEDLLKDDKVELVVIATPHDTHRELCVKAMDAGKHVVVDKAMCLTAQEADAMIQARDRNNVVFSVFHNRRWDGDFLTMKKVKEAGLLGEWFAVEAAVLGYGPARGWRAVKAKVGGQLYDWGAHLVDQALLIAGAEPKRVYCHARPVVWDMDADSHCKCLIEFENGLLYTIEICRGARIKKPRWLIQGQRGTLLKPGLDPQEKCMCAGNIDAAINAPEDRAQVVTDVNGILSEMVLDTVPGRWRNYYENIADVLLDGGELAVTPEQAADVVRVVEAGMKSADTGKAVDL